MVVHEIHDAAGFANALKDAKGKLVVVDFFATWCGPCKVVAPIFEQLSKTHEREAIFLKVDSDKVREVAQAAGVKALPSFGFYHDSKLLELQQGGDPKKLENLIVSLAAKHSTYAFKGTGNSMIGSSSTTAAKSTTSAAAASKATAPGGPPQRKNPWADPNFHLAKAATVAPTTASATSSSTSAATPAKPTPTPVAAKPTPTPTPVAAKPTPTPVAAAPKPVVTATPTPAKPVAPTNASSGSDATRVNPWATKEIPTTAPKATVPNPSPSTTAKPPTATTAASSTSTPTATVSAPIANGPVTTTATPSTATSTVTESSTAAAASSSSTSSTPAAPAGPVANDPALVKQLNPGFLSQLTDMGFVKLRAEKALILTGNKGVDPALNWLMEHEQDADIDEPLQVVGSAAKTPAGVNLDDMDEDERAIYENMQAKKLQERGVAFAGGANAGPAKVSTLNMTYEEKMEWLKNRRAEVKARKEAEALEHMKEQERNRKRTVKGAQALEELKEAQQRKAADDAIRAKRKEEEEKKKARANILAKLEEDKQRRREQAQREQEAIAAQKAAAEAAKAAKAAPGKR